uniref:Uncharacterized protein n=1 Tax=Arundo donax TaxID=35708 RepID=A0A0A8YCH1_ARUDO
MAIRSHSPNKHSVRLSS